MAGNKGDNIYMNTRNNNLKTRKCPAEERKPTSCETAMKFLLVFLGVLSIGASIALCVLGFLYHCQSVSFDELSERFANATAEVKMQAANLKTTVSEKQEEACTLSQLKFQQLRQCLHQQNGYLHDSTAGRSCELCDDGWTLLGLKCFFFSTDKLTWAESRDSCVEKGGHLVIITSQAEQDFQALQINDLYWIGLNDLETEGKWMWVNNKTLDEIGVQFWYKRSDQDREPDNWKGDDPSGENCACIRQLQGAKHWVDVSCRRKEKYICEKQIQI